MDSICEFCRFDNIFFVADPRSGKVHFTDGGKHRFFKSIFMTVCRFSDLVVLEQVRPESGGAIGDAAECANAHTHMVRGNRFTRRTHTDGIRSARGV